MKKPKRIFSVLLLFGMLSVVLAMFLPLYYSTWESRRVAQAYQGDGAIRTLTWWIASFVPVPGYGLRFPGVDLGQSSSAQYILGELPQKSLLVLFVAEGKEFEQRFGADVARKDLSARLRIAIFDEKGKRVFNVSKPIQALRWAIPEDAGVGMYDDTLPSFVPQKNTKYHLSVLFSGDPLLRRVRGHLFLRHGGSI